MNRHLLDTSALLTLRDDEEGAEKVAHQLSLADAWIAASAIQKDAVLVHKDPEFKTLDCNKIALPYK